jgi:hypothetical protein
MIEYNVEENLPKEKRGNNKKSGYIKNTNQNLLINQLSYFM